MARLSGARLGEAGQSRAGLGGAGLSGARLAVISVGAGLAVALPHASLGYQLALCVPVVAAFGLPHGAHDWALARRWAGSTQSERRQAGRGFAGWDLARWRWAGWGSAGRGVVGAGLAGGRLATFALIYAGLGTAAALMAWAVPWLALSAFVVLGIAHFGGEDAAALDLPATPALRAMLGTLPILGPAAFWPGQTAALLQMLDVPVGAGALEAGGVAALLGCGVLLASAAAQHHAARPALLREQAVLLLLLAAAPPVLSFTAYFCLVHAPRHNAALPPALRKWTAWPVTAAAVLLIAGPVGLAAWHMGQGWVWAATNALFWGLASLAWPHAVLTKMTASVAAAAAPAEIAGLPSGVARIKELAR